VKQSLVLGFESGGANQLVAYIQPKDGLSPEVINTAGLAAVCG